MYHSLENKILSKKEIMIKGMTWYEIENITVNQTKFIYWTSFYNQMKSSNKTDVDVNQIAGGKLLRY